MRKTARAKQFSSLNIPSTNVRVAIEKRIIIQNLVGWDFSSIALRWYDSVCKRTTKCVKQRFWLQRVDNSPIQKWQGFSTPKTVPAVIWRTRCDYYHKFFFFSSFHEIKQRHLLWKWSKMCCVLNKRRIFGKINMKHSIL